MSGLQELTRDGLEGMKGLAVVELYKPGCEPCEALQQVLERLSHEPAYQGKVEVYARQFVTGG